MEDETLNNVLKLLQNTSHDNQKSNQTNNTSNNNDLQTLLIKFLLSGGLNQILNIYNKNTNQTPNSTTEKVRTIDLKNYQRLD
ncbi:MAG: hypothetical protein IJ295_02580 [Clostridia bacterium]|nr:hypothetical protein [Clostridia bacterium]